MFKLEPFYLSFQNWNFVNILSFVRVYHYSSHSINKKYLNAYIQTYKRMCWGFRAGQQQVIEDLW
jgi:hypothetical protein